MFEKIRLDRKIGFQNMFYTKSINVIIDSIGPSIILMSIYIVCINKNLVAGFCPDIKHYESISFSSIPANLLRKW